MTTPMNAHRGLGSLPIFLFALSQSPCDCLSPGRRNKPCAPPTTKQPQSQLAAACNEGSSRAWGYTAGHGRRRSRCTTLVWGDTWPRVVARHSPPLPGRRGSLRGRHLPWAELRRCEPAHHPSHFGRGCGAQAPERLLWILVQFAASMVAIQAATGSLTLDTQESGC